MTGTQLRVARKAAHFTQDQLAERIGYGVRSVNRWETSGNAPIPRRAEAAIASVLASDRVVALPPERLSDQLDVVADGFEADGSGKLARHLRRLAAAHRAMDEAGDPEVAPLIVRHDA